MLDFGRKLSKIILISFRRNIWLAMGNYKQYCEGWTFDDQLQYIFDISFSVIAYQLVCCMFANVFGKILQFSAALVADYFFRGFQS